MKAWERVAGVTIYVLSIISLTVGALALSSPVALAANATADTHYYHPIPAPDDSELEPGQQYDSYVELNHPLQSPSNGDGPAAINDSTTLLGNITTLPATVTAASLVVTSTADSGAGTLRQALLDAVNGDTITFDPAVFPPGSPVTITLTSALPDITQGNLTIDASNAGVILDGSGIGEPDVDGLVVRSASNVIRGLQILHFPRIGIHLTTSAYNTIGGDATIGAGPSGQGNVLAGNGGGIYIGGGHDNVIVGNLIGTDASGMAAMANNNGVLLREGAQNNQIGGTTAGERNVIAANSTTGIQIMDADTAYNVVIGNFIGTNIAGSAAIGNTYGGVWIMAGASENRVGGTTAGERNLISGNDGDGVHITDLGTMSNTVSGNYIGIDVSGTAALPNGVRGVGIADGASYNLIGGDTEVERNIISGNGNSGVGIWGADTMSNTVSGNYIGTDVSGTTSIPNAGSGVQISGGASHNFIGGSDPSPGGTCTGECNLISGNEAGVHIADVGTMSNTVSGNYIGTDDNGTSALENDGDGVAISNGASNNIIGGDTPGERNLISGNGGRGVDISGSSTAGNTVSGNYIGTDASGAAELGNGEAGVWISDSASNNIIGGDTPGERNIISGNGYEGIDINGTGTMSNTVSGNYIGADVSGTVAISNVNNGIYIRGGASYNLVGGDTEAECNIISGNGNNGVSISDSDSMSNTVSGNFIGIDVSGTTALLNDGHGVNIENGASYSFIGGDTVGKRNVISGNSEDGVKIEEDATNNSVSSNYIGVDASGTAALGNRRNGVYINDASHNQVIDNLISGNDENGVGLCCTSDTSNNTIGGNYIGTDVGGSIALGNHHSGISIWGSASDNLIGGDTPGERNLISGNDGNGVEISGSGTISNSVSGNYIGTNITGTLALPNGSDGVLVEDGASYNLIGGDTPGERNLISGNGVDGVDINGTGTVSNTVSGNYIGTDVSSTTSIPNAGSGVQIGGGASDNRIGGNMPGEGNVIAHNGEHGVGVYNPGSLRNTIFHNSIHANEGLGIELDDGGNAELAAPAITGFDLGAGIVTGTACANCTVEVFSDSSDEGEVYEGQTTADGAGDWTFNKGASFTGPHLTATATDAAGNTSEFSDPAPPVNTPPTLSGLPDVIVNETTSLPVTIDLWAAAWDAETPPDELTYTIECTPTAVAGVTLKDNRYIIVNPSTDWCGYTDCTIRVTDPGGLWDSDTFRVAVTWSCQGPLDVPDQEAPQDEPIIIDLTAYEPDGGDEGPPLYWYATGEDHCTISGEHSDDDVLTLTSQAGFVGSDTVTLHMVYPWGNEATQALTLTWVTAACACHGERGRGPGRETGTT